MTVRRGFAAEEVLRLNKKLKVLTPSAVKKLTEIARKTRD